MLIRLRRLAVATVVAACLLTGCQPAATPTPSPAPSYSCTPEAGGDEFSCSQHQYDEMVARDKLYAEAEQVYRTFFAEDSRIYQEGGLDAPSQVILDTTTGDFFTDSMDLYRTLKKTKTTVQGEIRLVSLDRVPGAAKSGSLVALRSCVDGSETTIHSAGSPTEKGNFGSDLLFFVRADGVLKIASAEGEEVESC